jgi:glycosyltransferase involved in cell wall biosynthesis
MRLVMLQYGDYADAAERFASGGQETYYGQRYTVDFVRELAAKVDDVTVLNFSKDQPEKRLPSGVRSMGVQLYPAGQRSRHLALLRALASLKPTHLIVGAPMPLVLGWAMARGIRTLPLFADSFHATGLKARLVHGGLSVLLGNRRFEWVSNHNLAASLDLVRIGVSPNKVIPFDWPALLTPSARPPRTGWSGGDSFRIIYVGMVNELKGVGDLIAAIQLLNREGGVNHTLSVVGSHDGAMGRLADSLGVAGQVHFLGRVPHDQIVPLMAEHDAVVVPSRHEFPEGLPMTIYEGYCSRTPLVVSDHPMFRLKVRDRFSALMFPARDAQALAARVRELRTDGALYAALSRNAEEAASQHLCPLKFHELISRWLSGTPEDRRVLESYTLASGRYGTLDPDWRNAQ